MTYKVLENGRAAIISDIECWSNNEFESTQDAAMYAHNWLGPYSPGLGVIWNLLDTNGYFPPFDYNGYGDTVSILKDE